MNILRDRQILESEIKSNRGATASASLEVTPAGVLAIGLLVSGILLATGGLVAAAIREAGLSKARQSR